MKKFCCSIFALFYSCLSFEIFADLETYQLKNLNLLSEEFWDLDPTHGFPMVEGGALENFEFAYEEDLKELKAMVTTLFHRINPDEFTLATPGDKGVKAFHPKLIGKILGMAKILQNPKTQGISTENKSKALWDIFFQDEKALYEITQLRKLTCEHLKRAQTEGLSEEELSYHTKKAKFFTPDNPFKPTCIEDKTIVPKALKDNFTKMTKAFWNEKYKPYHNFVFLGLLWKKLNTREDVLEYYLGLLDGFELGKTKFPKIKITLFPEENLSLLEAYEKMHTPPAREGETGGGGGIPDETSKDSEEIKLVQTWLESRFSLRDFTERPDLAHYSESLYWLSSQVADTFHIEGQEMAIPFPHESGSRFADCCASLSKNFFKIVLDTNLTPREGLAPQKSYDTRILEELGALPEVIKFFENFLTRDAQKSSDARNQWGQITCDKKGVLYVNPPPIPAHSCELEAGRENMLALINALLFQKEGMPQANSWEELGQRIETARKRVWGDSEGDFSFQEWIGDSGTNENIGRLPLLAQGFSAGFNLVFQTGHFFLKANPKGALEEIDFKKALQQEGKNWITALNIYSITPTDEEKIRILFKLGSKKRSPFFKYFSKLSHEDESLPIFQETLSEVASAQDFYSVYKYFKNKRLGTNVDLLKRIFDLSYGGRNSGKYIEGLEKNKDFKTFPVAEFLQFYSRTRSYNSFSSENEISRSAEESLKKLLAIKFKETPPIFDSETGLFFYNDFQNDEGQRIFETSPDSRYAVIYSERRRTLGDDRPLSFTVLDLKENKIHEKSLGSRYLNPVKIDFSPDSQFIRVFELKSSGMYRSDLVQTSFDLKNFEEEGTPITSKWGFKGYWRLDPSNSLSEEQNYVLSADEDSFLRMYKVSPDWSKVALEITIFNFDRDQKSLPRTFWDWQGRERPLIAYLSATSGQPRTLHILENKEALKKEDGTLQRQFKKKFELEIKNARNLLSLSPHSNYSLVALQEGALFIPLPEETQILKPSILPLREYVTALGFTLDERFAITGTPRGVYFWSLPTGEQAHFLEYPFDQAIDFSLTPDGKSLLVIPIM